jgi:hypothetical protein
MKQAKLEIDIDDLRVDIFNGEYRVALAKLGPDCKPQIVWSNLKYELVELLVEAVLRGDL